MCSSDLGCLHFGLGTGSVNYNNYCGDYTPDPLPQYNYTLFPFWTDLIRDNNSKMLAKNFSDKAVFGWYDMKEYSRASDNSFEVILWANDSFEFRYGALDIINHDVLIGEVGSGSSEIYQYLYHDKCNTGSTNTSDCVNTTWNDSSSNAMLENGGSLFGSGSGNGVDCSNPLNDYSCTGYWEAYDDQQSDDDPQYAPFCAGYRFEQDVGYFIIEEEYAYGISQEVHMGYEEPIDIFYNDLYTSNEQHNSFPEYDYYEPQELFLVSTFEEPLPFELHPLPEIVPLEEFLQVQTYDEIIITEIREPQEEMFITFQEFEELFEEERLVEEERIEETRKQNELISSLPSGILVFYEGTDHYKLSLEQYEKVCNATKIIPQRAIMGANFLNFRAHHIYTINGNKIDETFVKWNKENNKCFAGFTVSGNNGGVDEKITVDGEVLNFLSTGIDTRVYFIKNF